MNKHPCIFKAKHDPLIKGADWILLHLDFTACKDLDAELDLHTELSQHFQHLPEAMTTGTLSAVLATLKWTGQSPQDEGEEGHVTHSTTALQALSVHTHVTQASPSRM